MKFTHSGTVQLSIMSGAPGVIVIRLLTLMSFGLTPCTAHAQCDSPLGLEDGNITDDQLSASSTYSTRYTAKQARLNGGNGWVSSYFKTIDQLTVDLASQHEVRRFSVQGSKIGWFSRTVQLFYSHDKLVWEKYVSGDGLDVLDGNSDSSSVNTIDLNPPIRARFITFNPLTWYGSPSLRLELYGCELDQPIPVRYTDVSRDIQTAQEWIPSLSPYVINSMVNIRPSGSLRIQPGVKVVFNSTEAGLYVFGHLEANGLSGLPVVFSSSYPVYREVKKWTGLQVLEQGILRMNHCTINGAFTGIKGPLTSIQVRNCHIHHNNLGVDLPMGDTDPDRVHFLGTTFSYNKKNGIETRSTWLGENIYISIKDSAFAGNSFFIKSTSGVRVENTVFSKSQNGITSDNYGMNVTLINCTFSDNDGSGFSMDYYQNKNMYMSFFNVSNCTFKNNANSGISVHLDIFKGLGISVTKCVFRDNGHNGIRITFGVVTDNTFLKIKNNVFVAEPRQSYTHLKIKAYNSIVNASLNIESNSFLGREAILVDAKNIMTCEVSNNTFTELTGDRGLYFKGAHEVRLFQNSFENCSSTSVIVTNVLKTTIIENSFVNPDSLQDLLIEPPYSETYWLHAEKNFWGSSDKLYVRARVCDFYCDIEKLMADIHPFYTTEAMTELSSDGNPDQFYRQGSDIGGQIAQSVTLGPHEHLFVSQSIFVPTGVQLTILQNTTLVFSYKQGIFVRGILEVEGEKDGRVVLTNNRTDKVLWGGIVFNSTESFMRFTTVRNAKYGLNIQTNTSGSLVIMNTTITQCTTAVQGFHWANSSLFLHGVNISKSNKALVLKEMEENFMSLDIQHCYISGVNKMQSDINGGGFNVSLKNSLFSGSSLFEISACFNSVTLSVIDTSFISTFGYSMNIFGGELDLTLRNVSTSGNYGHINITGCSNSYLSRGTIDLRDSNLMTRNTHSFQISNTYFRPTSLNVTIMNNEITTDQSFNAIYIVNDREYLPWTVSIFGNILHNSGPYLSGRFSDVKIQDNTISTFPETSFGLERKLYSLGNSSCFFIGNTIHNSVVHLFSEKDDYVFQVTENTFNTCTVEVNTPVTVFFRNTFLNGSGNDIKYVGTGHAGQKVNCSYNYWGTISSNAIERRIYDSSDDESLPNLIFRPFYIFPNLTEPQSPEESFLSPDGTIGGRVGGSVTLTRDGSPYTVTSHIVIDKMDTLIIEAGVTLLFLRSVKVKVEGTFKVQGNKSHPVIAKSMVIGEKWAGVKLHGHSYRHTDSNSAPVRLVGGKDEREGRLEVKVGNSWGTVCGEDLGRNDVAVACRMLGYSSSENDRVYWSGHFGIGSGPVYLGDVRCSGDEHFLFECSANTSPFCGHYQDLCIRCEGDELKDTKVQNEVELSYLTINDTLNGLELNGNVTLVQGIVSNYSQNHGIVINAGHPSMTSLHIDNFVTSKNTYNGIGFISHSLTYSRFYLLELHLSNCEISSNKGGIGSVYPVNVSIYGCHFRDNTDKAIFLENSASYNIDKCEFSQNGGGCFDIDPYEESRFPFQIVMTNSQVKNHDLSIDKIKNGWSYYNSLFEIRRQETVEGSIVFMNNTFSNNLGKIFNLHFSSTTAKYSLTFENNTFYDNIAVICKLDPSASTAIDFNFLDNTVINNTAAIPSEPLIEIMYHTNANGSRINITGNTFENNTAFQAVVLSNSRKSEANTSIMTNIFLNNNCKSILSTVVFDFGLKGNIFDNQHATCELESADFERWHNIDARLNFWGADALFEVTNRICGFDINMSKIFVRYMPFYLSEVLSSVSSDSHADFFSDNLHGGVVEGHVHLERSRSPYHIKRSIFIRNEGFLEVDDGVELRFSPNTGIYVDGVFKAMGFSNRVIFTNSSVASWFGVVFPFKTGNVSDTVRLVNGSSPREGRIELFVNGSWSTICNIHNHEAKLICQALGYEQGETSQSNIYGPGEGPIIRYLGCGNEHISLAECNPSLTGGRYCKHEGDKGLSCKNFVSSIGTAELNFPASYLEKVSILNSRYGLHMKTNTARISQCLINHTEKAGLTLEGDGVSMDLNGTVVQHGQSDGIILKPRTRVVIGNGTTQHNRGNGMRLTNPVYNVRIEDIYFNENSKMGLYIWSPYAYHFKQIHVRNNVFANHSQDFGLSFKVTYDELYADATFEKNTFINNNGGSISMDLDSFYRRYAIQNTFVRSNRFISSGPISIIVQDEVSIIFEDNFAINCTGGKSCFIDLSTQKKKNVPTQSVTIATNKIEKTHGNCVFNLNSNNYVFNGTFNYNQILASSTKEAAIILDSNQFSFFYNLLDNPEADYELKVVKTSTDEVKADRNWWGTTDANTAGARILHRSQDQRLMLVNYMPILTDQNFDCSEVNNCTGRGECVRPNGCRCISGWTGASCVDHDCSGVGNCTGNGRCVGPNQCECTSGWEGESCVVATCHDVRNCSGRERGFCVSPNQCVCVPEFTGSDCSLCASLRWGPSCLPCQRCKHGTCNIKNGQCECEAENWTGEECDRCSDTFYGPKCMPYINILNVIPSSGPDSGGTSVHVWGHNFPETPNKIFYCRFDRTVVNATRLSSEHTVCKSPQHHQGAINIEISANGTEFSQNQTKFTYYALCPPGSCGKTEDPPHGYCRYGGCVCILPWSGGNCSIEIKAPVISPEFLNHTIEEGNGFRLQVTLTQGSPPLRWNLFGAPEGMKIAKGSGDIYWERAVARETPYTVRVRASNIIGQSEGQLILTVPLSYNVTIDQVTPNGSLPSPRAVRITGHVNFFSQSAFSLIAFVDVKIRNKGKFSSTMTVVTLPNTKNRIAAVYFYKAGDSGLFEVDGRHPSDSSFTAQKSWSVLGMKCDPSYVSRQAYMDTDLMEMRNVAVLRNDGIGVIRDIRAIVRGIEGPLNSVVVRINSSRSDEPAPLIPALEPDSEVEFDLIINASRPLRGTIGLVFNTIEGTVARMRVGLQLKVRRPVLLLSTKSISDSIPRATQKTYQVNITNDGEVPATALRVTLPSKESRLDVTSFSNSSTQASESGLDLQAGASAVLVLTVTIGPSDVLGEFSGSVALNSDLSTASISYKFYITSLDKLNVTVRIEDEFTYFASDKPFVAGAVVTLRNPRRGYLEQRITTNSTEFVTFEDVTEDRYTLTATAPGHASSSRVIIAKPSDSSHSVFLQRVAVTYTWTVTPTTFQDKYVITLESTFETHVPMPIVTVEPININLIPYEEGKKDVINFNITNHGLIRADNVRLVLPTNQPTLLFTQTVDPIGDLPANTSIIVPVTVIRKIRVKRYFLEISCGMKMLYDYFCGETRTGGQDITLSRQYPGRPPYPCNGGYGGGGESTEGGLGSSVGGGIFGISGTDNFSSRPSSSVVIYIPEVPLSCNCPVNIIKDCALGFTLVGGCGTAVYGLTTSSGFLGRIKSALDFGFACIMGPLSFICPLCGLASELWTAVGCIKSVNKSCKINRRRRAANSEVVQGLLNSSGSMRNYLIMMKEIFGGEEMFNVYDNSWMNPFNLALAKDSEGGQFLSESEITSITAPLNVTLVPTVRNFLLRWNNTVSAWEDGTLTTLGADDRVMAYNTVMSTWEQFQIDMESAKQRGFDSIFDEFANALEVYKENKKKGGKDEGVCAKVRVRIVQELVLTRDAFNARLEMENGEQSTLQNINVTIDIRPTYGDGTYTNDKFSIGKPKLVGITAVDGTGQLAQDMSGTAEWLIIPYSTAAVKENTLYDVGGTLSYTVDGSDFSISLLPDIITVKPNPSLVVNYFHEKYVQGDDPLTADVKEPVIPFTLAVSVSNGAYGVARQLKITSSQPEIIENEKGLLVSFKIIGAQLGSNPVTPSLAIDFGDIDSFETKTARWLLTSSLKGTFYNFTASFENINPLGDPQLSILDHLGYYQLVHLVRLETTEDEFDDFLVNDVLDEDEMPDTVYDSSRGLHSSPVVEALVKSFYLQNNELDKTRNYSHVIVSAVVNTEGPSTYFYIRLVNNITRDSISESMLEVVRNDGKNILVNKNAWQTSYYHDNFYLHIFDSISGVNSSTAVSYSISFGLRNMFSPVFAQESYEVEVSISQTPGTVMSVSATDQDKDSILQFSLHNTSSFSIDEFSGEIRSLIPLKIGSYEFSVSVTDSGRPSRSSTARALVIITDGVPVALATVQMTQGKMSTSSSDATSSKLATTTPSSVYSSSEIRSSSEPSVAYSSITSNTPEPVYTVTTTTTATASASGPSDATTVGVSKSNRFGHGVTLLIATCFLSLGSNLQ